ncbi:MAG TPA: GntR family transcriptional regulator [Thermoanaerobaculia bacterium]|nr:GntR family transcriptional regulator [Thermoanaerobaculia bacterium]
MDLRIDAASHTPIYEQVAAQVRALVASGRLPAGERLPSVRGLAEHLLINPNTVARAYRELERDGVVVSRQGHGIFVNDQASPFRAAQRRRMLAASVDRLFDEAAQLGLEPTDVEDLVRRRVEGGRSPKRGIE